MCSTWKPASSSRATSPARLVAAVVVDRAVDRPVEPLMGRDQRGAGVRPATSAACSRRSASRSSSTCSRTFRHTIVSMPRGGERRRIEVA